MPTILVPLDGSPRATAALPVAATLARVLRGTVHLLHVAEWTPPPPELLESLGLSAPDLRGTVIDVASGSPAAAVVRAAAAWDDALIVLCTHTSEDKPFGMLGHVADGVLRGTTTPLVLVQPERGHRPWKLERILVPHDGTPATAAGFPRAIDIADRAAAELTILHVAAPGERQPREPGSYTVPRYIDQPQYEWPAWATEFLERVCCPGGVPDRVRLRLRLSAGEPGRQIIRFARREATDLIVMTWHGHAEANRAATLKTVIARAPCPILVLRAPEPGRAAGR